jgi:hypothetical protein
MIKVIGRATALLGAIALASCSAGMSVDDQAPTNTVDGTGGVNFDLDIPNGESIDEILLHLVCADGIDQNHVLDVVDGEVVASFGGLTPGLCTATMTSQTPGGTDCIGTQDFTVVENVTTPVTVTLMCQGTNDAGGGSALVSAEFEMKGCAVDRIKKIWAIPANLLEGESTSVEVESWGNLVETANPATWSFEVVSGTGSDAVSTGAGCTGEACSDFTCGDVSALAPVDPSTGLPTQQITVKVTVEDDDCYDSELVYIDCAQSSVCGDGVADGVEECDGTDGINPLTEECNACVIEYCGDGSANTAFEDCDGTDGVIDPLTTTCDSSCNLIPLPYCGDDIINDGADLPGVEQCDGAGLPYPGAVCDASCQIVPFCGNGVAEGSEQCDLGAGNGPFPATCSTSCTTNAAPNLCLDCLEATVQPQTDNCQGNALCDALLQCLTTNDCYYPNASDCYCGTGYVDVDACEADTNPVASNAANGDCKAEMLAYSAATTNSAALAAVYPPFQMMSIAANITCLDWEAPPGTFNGPVCQL